MWDRQCVSVWCVLAFQLVLSQTLRYHIVVIRKRVVKYHHGKELGNTMYRTGCVPIICSCITGRNAHETTPDLFTRQSFQRCIRPANSGDGHVYFAAVRESIRHVEHFWMSCAMNQKKNAPHAGCSIGWKPAAKIQIFIP